jgi:Tfp pilus assembly protein PilN
MVNINFVPDDYIQKRETMRTNLMYMVLFSVVLAALGGAFMVLKVRQRSINVQAQIINAKMAQAKEEITKLEDLQNKRKEMMEAALATAELIEPVPRTILLAELTNALPGGVSLRKIKLVEQQIAAAKAKGGSSSYDKAKATAGNKKSEAKLPEVQLTKTNLEIEGIAPSDIQVAGYIAVLNSSTLLDNVTLVYSSELGKDESTYREFRLMATLKKDVHLSQSDIDGIRAKRQSLL